MTKNTEKNVVEKLEKALSKHTNADGTARDDIGSFMDALMSDPDVVAAVKDVSQFVDETHEETKENWKKRAKE